MIKGKKANILDSLKNAHPQDLSIEEIARASRVSRETASKYIGILEAEGEVELSRAVGRAKMYRLKK